jgi:hypothetical protein
LLQSSRPGGAQKRPHRRDGSFVRSIDCLLVSRIFYKFNTKEPSLVCYIEGERANNENFV